MSIGGLVATVLLTLPIAWIRFIINKKNPSFPIDTSFFSYTSKEQEKNEALARRYHMNIFQKVSRR